MRSNLNQYGLAINIHLLFIGIVKWKSYGKTHWALPQLRPHQKPVYGIRIDIGQKSYGLQYPSWR